MSTRKSKIARIFFLVVLAICFAIFALMNSSFANESVTGENGNSDSATSEHENPEPTIGGHGNPEPITPTAATTAISDSVSSDDIETTPEAVYPEAAYSETKQMEAIRTKLSQLLAALAANLPSGTDPDPTAYIDETDYSLQMIEAVCTGDLESGYEAENQRNVKIDRYGLEEADLDLGLRKFTFDELWYLSKIITAEAGSSWLSMEWKMAVGEVLLNRVASSEFPDEISECVYQPGQYYGRNNKYFAGLLPNKASAVAAIRLLNGERVLNNPAAVFQANFRQGSGIVRIFDDSYLGKTYICLSEHPEYYSV